MKYFVSVVVLVAIVIFALSVERGNSDSTVSTADGGSPRPLAPPVDPSPSPSADLELANSRGAERSALPNASTEGVEPEFLLPVTTIVRERGEDQVIPNLAFHLEVNLRNGGEVAESSRFSFDGKTDEEGRARVPFPRSLMKKICEEGPEQLAGWLTEPGYQERVRVIRKRITRGEAKLDHLILKLWCSPGSTLRGSVVNTDGDPISARLTAAGEGGEGLESIGSCRALVGKYASLLPKGEFVLHVSRTEGPYSVRASSGDLGATVIRGLELDPSGEQTPLRIVIGEGHRIVGTLIGQSGEPLANAWLEAHESRLEYDRNVAYFNEPSGNLEVAFGRDGRTSDSATTDEQGRFEFLGLQDSSFLIHLEGEEGRGATLTPEPVWTHGPPLVLRLEEPMLWISLVDSEGEPFDGSIGRFRDFGFGVAPHPWPKELELRVSARPPSEGGARSTRSVSLRSAGSSRWRTRVEPGVEYEIGVFGPQRPWTSTCLTIPEDGGAQTCELVVPDAVPTGTVVLSVVDSAGSHIEHGFRVMALDPRGGIPLAEWEAWDIEAWPAELTLPAGEHLLRIEGVTEFDGHHGTVWGRRTLGAFERPVRVPAQGRVSVEANLGGGGRVRVRTAGPPPPEPSREGLARWEIDALEKGPTAGLQLHREGAWPMPLEFVRMGMEGTSGEGEHLYYSVFLGKEATSELTPPGRYLLVGRLDDGRTAQKEIRVVEGEVIDVELHFP